MGKRILSQHRGKGGIQYRAPKKGKILPAKYPKISNTSKAEVIDLIHERGRSAPLAKIKLEENVFAYLPAVSGLKVGHVIEIGSRANPQVGNILPLSKIPEGSIISNIELSPGDGGKFVKSSGSSALLFSQTPKGTLIRFSSGKAAVLNSNCRASLGKIAGGGRNEKPFLRAGPKHHLLVSKGKLYPRVRGVAMASVHHPFGGGRHQHVGKPTTTSRNAPPGRKVGLIAARKTGTKRLIRNRMEGNV